MNEKLILDQIEHIAQYGKDGDGVTRLAFSKADMQAREYITNLMEESGLAVRIDSVGNIIGRLEGSDLCAPAVLTGSHLDTVPQGGKYDGVIGVVGGIAAVRRLRERGTLKHPLEVVVFAAEESSRFAYGTIGSKAMTGQTNISAWKKSTDQGGKSFAEALADAELDVDNIKLSARSTEEVKAFIELHIEQGRMLQREDCKIGIVETVAAPTRLKIVVEGMASHSGTTPMEERNDALVNAAMIILAIREIALEKSHTGTVATVGALKVLPGAMNVIPGKVEMWVDIRGVELASIIECLQEIKDAVSTIADEQETAVAIEMLSADKPIKMDREIMDVIKQVCQKANVDFMEMVSGAGHDAMNMAKLAPSAIIFIPCANGISHSPEEYVEPADIMIGIDVLTEVLYQLAK